MRFHSPDGTAHWFPDFEVQEIKPALDPAEIARGVKSWVFLVAGRVLEARETVEELTGK